MIPDKYYEATQTICIFLLGAGAIYILTIDIKHFFGNNFQQNNWKFVEKALL